MLLNRPVALVKVAIAFLGMALVIATATGCIADPKVDGRVGISVRSSDGMPIAVIYSCSTKISTFTLTWTLPGELPTNGTEPIVVWRIAGDSTQAPVIIPLDGSATPGVELKSGHPEIQSGLQYWASGGGGTHYLNTTFTGDLSFTLDDLSNLTPGEVLTNSPTDPNGTIVVAREGFFRAACAQS